MKFKKDPEGPFEDHFCGRYKVKKYDAWYAFFKPVGWQSWGNSCEKTPRGDSVKHKTMRKAIQGCIRHHHTFGDDPQAYEHLKK